MSAPIPADLRELYDAASTVKEAMLGLWIPHAGPRVVELIERIAALEAQLAAYNTNGFADSDAMASAYLDVRERAEQAEANLENARKANRTWRCFHCEFTTSDTEEALAHFGDRDDAEEFSPLCKWWSNMDDQERKEQFQCLIQELNGEREGNHTVALEAQNQQLRDAAVALLTIGPNSPEECCEGEGCEWCDMKAALAATEKKP